MKAPYIQVLFKPVKPYEPWHPTIWHFDMSRLRRASAASF